MYTLQPTAKLALLLTVLAGLLSFSSAHGSAVALRDPYAIPYANDIEQAIKPATDERATRLPPLAHDSAECRQLRTDAELARQTAAGLGRIHSFWDLIFPGPPHFNYSESVARAEVDYVRKCR